MKIEELEHEEKRNALLVSLKKIEAEPPYNAPNGITPRNIEFYLGLKEPEVSALLTELIADGLVSATKNGDNNYEHCLCTDKSNEMFKALERRSLNDISVIVLQKAYEWYQRYNYNQDIQINSVVVSHSVGMSNHEKVLSAIRNLIDRGLVRKWAITHQFITFSLTIDGVTLMEHPKEKPTPIAPIVIHGNQGNISIASSYVAQTVNRNEIEKAFRELEASVRNEVPPEQQKEALENLEAAEDLAKAEKPKKNIISRLLGYLPQVPAIIDGAKKILDMVSKIPS